MLRGTTQLCARRRTLCNPVTWVIPSPPTILTVGSAALLPGELPASCPVRPLNLRSASLYQRMDGYFSGSRHLDASILPRKKGFCKGKICGIIKEKEGRAGHETAKRCGYRGGGAHGKKPAMRGLSAAVLFARGAGIYLPEGEPRRNGGGAVGGQGGLRQGAGRGAFRLGNAAGGRDP